MQADRAFDCSTKAILGQVGNPFFLERQRLRETHAFRGRTKRGSRTQSRTVDPLFTGPMFEHKQYLDPFQVAVFIPRSVPAVKVTQFSIDHIVFASVLEELANSADRAVA